MKKGKFLVCFLCTLGIISLVISLFKLNSNEDFIVVENNTAASSEDVYDYSISGVKSYLNKIYGDGKVKNITQTSKQINEDVANFSQSDLNKNYNNRKGNVGEKDKATGTCTIVACLGLVTYFSDIDDFDISDSYYDNYENIYDACLIKKYTTLNNGTQKNKVNNCVTESFNVNNSSRKGNTNWWELHNNIRDAVNNNTPIILDLKNHSTVVVGLATYEYDCEKEVEVGWWFWEKRKEIQTIHESKEFVIINEGWSYSGHSIVPLELITDTWDGHQVCWAEK